MMIYRNWVEAGAMASTPEVTAPLHTAYFPYNGHFAFASRHLIPHLRLSPVLAPTVAALAGLGDGA